MKESHELAPAVGQVKRDHWRMLHAKRTAENEVDDTHQLAEGASVAPSTARSRRSTGSRRTGLSGTAGSLVASSPKFNAALERSAHQVMERVMGAELSELRQAVGDCARQQQATNQKLDNLCDLVAKLSPSPNKEKKRRRK